MPCRDSENPVEEGFPSQVKSVTDLQKAKAWLGKPYYETEDFLLFNADCLESMRKIEEPLVALTITSPPYNIGKEYETVLPLDEYLKWSQDWMHEVYRITKPFGTFMLNVGYVEIPQKGHAVPLAYALWDKAEFYLMQEIVWNYGAGVAARRCLSPRNEKILWYVKNQDQYTFNLDDIRDKDVKYPNQKKKGKIRVNTIGKNPSDVWQIAKVTSGTGRASPERTPHPAQFPVDLIERVVKGFSNKGDLILDPFMGSGTVAEVALRHGRRAIGFEIEKKYCNYAVERVSSLLPEYIKSSS